MRRFEIEEKKKELQAELESLEKELHKKDKLTSEQEIAEALHDLLCTLNHDDQCSWSYELWIGDDDSSTSVRSKYCHVAKELLNLFEDDKMKILKAIEILNII